MRLEWDEGKNRSNFVKHKISFETARLVFDDAHARSARERFVAGEERWQTIGSIKGLLVVVAHTYYLEGEEEVIRIISARKATPAERRAHEAHEASD